MKIAIINISKPAFGTGDKITEYTYQIYKNMRNYKDMKIDLIYAIEETKRNNVQGILYTNTIFKRKIPKIAKIGYDIVHITNQELGFAAKLLKNNNCKAKIVTTIHDTMRLRSDLHRGLKQKFYNTITASSIKDALEYSDYLLFDDPGTAHEIKALYDIKNYSVTPLGVRDSLLESAPKKQTKHKKFVVGYVGPLDPNKNILMVLNAAKMLVKDHNFEFHIYGSGPELDNLMSYKIENSLDNVDFKGFVLEENIKDIYDSFDAFAYPAFGELYSLIIVEAMSRGLPVIISKEGNITSDVRKNCLEVKDADQFKELIVKLSKNGYDKQLRQAALDYARSFTWVKTTKETHQIYEKLLKGKHM